MKIYRAIKKVKSEGKEWAYIVEIDENKKNISQTPQEVMVTNIAWTNFQKFASDNEIDISKEKKSFKIEYLGDDKNKVLKEMGIDPKTGEPLKK